MALEMADCSKKTLVIGVINPFITEIGAHLVEVWIDSPLQGINVDGLGNLNQKTYDANTGP